MKNSALTITALLLAFLCLPPGLRAEEPPEDESAPEELLFMEVPVVVSASRKEQPVTEAPAAVTVITAEDIRQSGAINIPDLLRSVSGVDVMTITARDQQVGIRGLNGPINHKLLVLIDGRQVYIDFAGDVQWSFFPVSLDEIERIEVIKSPISTLYGANAFSGVVNIITRTPKELNGTEMNLAGGTRETLLASMMHGGEWKNLRYKLSGAFDRSDEWGSGDRAADVYRGNFLLSWVIGPEHEVALSGGSAHFDDNRLFINEATGKLQQTWDYDYLQADYMIGRFKLRAFRKSEDVDQIRERSGAPDKWDVSAYDAETQYSLDAGESHSLVFGANYRHLMQKKNNTIPEDHNQDLYALFGEDEFRLTETVRLIAGARFDHHPLVKSHFSPRGTLLYEPAEGESFRLSVSQAYRNPSLIESFIGQTIPGVPFAVVNTGNTNLKSEGVLSYEFGYRKVFMERATLGLNLFYNEYSDLIIGSRVVAPPQIMVGFVNGGDAWGVGGELDLDIMATDWLSMFANYSYQRTTDTDDNPYTTTVNEKDRVRHDVAQHRVNLGIMGKFGSGWSANLLLHWVDSTERLIKDLAGNEYIARVRSYTTVDGRVGYTFLKGNAEASLAILNMFNDKHYEYPPGINLPDSSSDKVGRKAVFKLSWRF